MGKYWDRYLLRNDYAFDNIVEEVARDVAIRIRDDEPEDAPVHAARLAMAERILRGRDAVVETFFRELKDRAVREAAFLDAAFENPKPDGTGMMLPRAEAIPDALLESGVAAVFNEAALIAWPTILTDTAPEEETEQA